MFKFCRTCKRSYPGALHTCPTCQLAKGAPKPLEPEVLEPEVLEPEEVVGGDESVALGAESGERLGEGPRTPPRMGKATQLSPRQARATQLARQQQAKTTQLAPKKSAQPTQLAPKQAAQPTRLAPAGELDIPEEPRTPRPQQPAAKAPLPPGSAAPRKPAQATQLAPKKNAPTTQLAPKQSAPPTQLAPKKSAQPTQLAPKKPSKPTQLASPEELAADEPPTTPQPQKAPRPPGMTPATPARPAQPTQLAPKQSAKPTQLAPKKPSRPTQLASPEELAADEPPTTPQPQKAPRPPGMTPATPARPAQPTQLAPKKSAPATQLAPKKSAPATQLASPEELGAVEPPAAKAPPAPPAKAARAPGAAAAPARPARPAQPTQLAPKKSASATQMTAPKQAVPTRLAPAEELLAESEDSARKLDRPKKTSGVKQADQQDTGSTGRSAEDAYDDVFLEDEEPPPEVVAEHSLPSYDTPPPPLKAQRRTALRTGDADVYEVNFDDNFAAVPEAPEEHLSQLAESQEKGIVPDEVGLVPELKSAPPSGKAPRRTALRTADADIYEVHFDDDFSVVPEAPEEHLTQLAESRQQELVPDDVGLAPEPTSLLPKAAPPGASPRRTALRTADAEVYEVHFDDDFSVVPEAPEEHLSQLSESLEKDLLADDLGLAPERKSPLSEPPAPPAGKAPRRTVLRTEDADLHEVHFDDDFSIVPEAPEEHLTQLAESREQNLVPDDVGLAPERTSLLPGPADAAPAGGSKRRTALRGADADILDVNFDDDFTLVPEAPEEHLSQLSASVEKDLLPDDVGLAPESAEASRPDPTSHMASIDEVPSGSEGLAEDERAALAALSGTIPPLSGSADAPVSDEEAFAFIEDGATPSGKEMLPELFEPPALDSGAADDDFGHSLNLLADEDFIDEVPAPRADDKPPPSGGPGEEALDILAADILRNEPSNVNLQSEPVIALDTGNLGLSGVALGRTPPPGAPSTAESGILWEEDSQAHLKVGPSETPISTKRRDDEADADADALFAFAEEEVASAAQPDSAIRLVDSGVGPLIGPSKDDVIAERTDDSDIVELKLPSDVKLPGPAHRKSSSGKHQPLGGDSAVPLLREEDDLGEVAEVGFDDLSEKQPGDSDALAFREEAAPLDVPASSSGIMLEDVQLPSAGSSVLSGKSGDPAANSAVDLGKRSVPIIDISDVDLIEEDLAPPPSSSAVHFDAIAADEDDSGPIDVQRVPPVGKAESSIRIHASESAADEVIIDDSLLVDDDEDAREVDEEALLRELAGTDVSSPDDAVAEVSEDLLIEDADEAKAGNMLLDSSLAEPGLDALFADSIEEEVEAKKPRSGTKRGKSGTAQGKARPKHSAVDGLGSEDDIFVDGDSSSKQNDLASGVDIIAEALESHTDLLGAKKLRKGSKVKAEQQETPPPRKGSKKGKAKSKIDDEGEETLHEEINLDAYLAADDESSAIDLGSTANIIIPPGLAEHELFTSTDPEVDLDEVDRAVAELGQAKPKLRKDAELEATQAFLLNEETADYDAIAGALKPRTKGKIDPAASDADEVVVIDENLLEEGDESMTSAETYADSGVDDDALLAAIEEEVGAADESVEIDDSLVVVEEEDEEVAEISDSDLAEEEEEVAEISDSDLAEDAEEIGADDLDAAIAEELGALGEVDEADAADILAADDALVETSSGQQPILQEPEEDDAVAVAVVEEEIAEVSAADLEEEPFAAPRARRRRSRRPRRSRRRAAAKPRYARRWLAGTLVGVLLATGGVVALMYKAPDIFNQGVEKLPEMPYRFTLLKEPTAADLAREAISKGEFEAALQKLPIAAGTEQLELRGEAGYRKYAKELDAKKQVIDPNADLFKQSVKDLKEAKSELSERLLREIQTRLDKEEGERQLIKQRQDSDLKFAMERMLKEAEQKRIADVEEELRKRNIIKQNLEELKTLAVTLAQAKDAVEALEKLLETKPDMVADKAEQLVKAKTKADETLAKINDSLTKAKIAAKDEKGIAELSTLRDTLEAERNKLVDTIRVAVKELNDGKDVKITEPNKDLLNQAEIAREAARAPLVNAMTKLADSFRYVPAGTSKYVEALVDRSIAEAKLKYYQAREPLIQKPEQKLHTWIAIFRQRGARQPADITSAGNDLQWVLSAQARASQEDRGKAQYLQGLIYRNEEKFEEARTSLKEATTMLREVESSWHKDASMALEELRSASVYYLPQARQLQAQGKPADAIAALTLALKALPDDPQLLALRGLIRLEQLHYPDGKVPMELQTALRTDAEGALKDGETSAIGFYLQGRLEEELGQLDKAETSYRKAEAAAKTNPEVMGMVTVALARLLLRERGAPAPAAAEEAKGAPPGAEESASDEQEFFILAQPVPEFPDDDDPATVARIKESLQLADKLIKSDDKKLQAQGYMIRGLAYTKQGRKTEGLKEYLKGLVLEYPGRTTAELIAMIESHPSFLQPDVLRQQNPVLAEVHFGKGLHLYHASEYDKAEIQFKRAVAFDNRDARYHYFLGLALTQQGDKLKRTAAAEAFRQGGRLEAQALPTSEVINVSLERVQGPVRQYLSTQRQKALIGVD